MKKFIILFLLTLFLLPSSTGFAEVRPPEWSDYCPTQYANAKYDNNDYSYHWDTWKNIFLFCSIIGFPKYADNYHKAYVLLVKQNEQITNNYWALKRIAFEKEKEICKSDPSNQSLCYLKVMEREETRQNREEMKKEMSEIAQRQMFIQSLNNMESSLQAQQLNNNLKNINDSINNLKY
ncbi:MAG: hypothetical protein WCG23_10260 [bacterium]